MKKRRRKRKKKVFETIKDALAHNFLLFLFQKKKSEKFIRKQEYKETVWRNLFQQSFA